MATGGQDICGEISDDSDGWEKVKQGHRKCKQLETDKTNQLSNDKRSTFRSSRRDKRGEKKSNGCPVNRKQRGRKYDREKISSTSEMTKPQFKIGKETGTTATKCDVDMSQMFGDADVNSRCEVSKSENTKVAQKTENIERQTQRREENNSDNDEKKRADEDLHTKISTNRYARLHFFVHKAGLYFLRLTLLQFIKLANCEDVDIFLKPFKSSLKKELNNKDKIKTLFPKEGKCDINKLDLALLIVVLLHCCTFEKKLNKSELKKIFQEHVKKTHKDVDNFLKDSTIKEKIDAIRNTIPDYEYNEIIFPETCAPTDVDDWSVKLLLRVMITTSVNGDNNDIKQVLRNVIEQQYDKGSESKFNDLKSFLQNNERRLTEEKKNGIISDKDFRLIFPANNKLQNIDKWNNKILVFVVLGIGETLPQSTINAIKRIRNARNELSHPTSLSMQPDVYSKEWNDMYKTFKELVKDQLPEEFVELKKLANRYGKEDLDPKEVCDILEEKNVQHIEAAKALNQMIQPLATTAEYGREDNQKLREIVLEIRIAAKNQHEEHAAENELLENKDTMSVLRDKFNIIDIRKGCVLVVIRYSSLQQLHEFMQYICSPELKIGLDNMASNIKLEQIGQVKMTACVPWPEMSKIRNYVDSYYPEKSATISTIVSNSTEVLTNPEVQESFRLLSKELSTKLKYNVKVCPMLPSHLLGNNLCKVTGGTGKMKEALSVGTSQQTVDFVEPKEKDSEISMITPIADTNKKVLDENKQDVLSAVTSQEAVSVASVNKAGVETVESGKMAIKQTVEAGQKVLDKKQHELLSAVTSQEAVSVKAVTSQEAVSVKAVTSQEAVSVKVVTSQEAVSVKAVTYQEAVSVKAVTSQEAVSVKAVTSQEAVSVKAVTSQEAVSVKAVKSQEAVSVKAVTSKELVSVAGVNKAGEETVESGKMAIKQTVEAGQKVLEDTKQDIISVGTSSLAAVNKALTVEAESAIQRLTGMTDNSLSRMRKVLEENKQDILSVVTSQELSSVAAVNKARVEAESAIQKQKQQYAGMTDNSLSRKRKALQKHLISTYKEELSTPLFPVFQIDDMNIEEMYVEPNMRLIDPQREPKDKGVPINSYQDIFRDERKKEIYVLGDAGTGKTSLCQEMVSIWSQVHSKTIDNKTEDQLVMAKFDFLFYISLRDTVSIKGVEEMITDQLELERYQDQLPEILENDKCLVILDGLDEWTTENTDARSSSINKGIPGRQGITNCTVLTTTRPSKFEAIQLKTTQIDTKVELLGIQEKSSKKLIKTIIGFLNAKHGNHKTERECLAKLNQSGLSCFLSIPVILKQLICLWYFGKHLGTTKCAIYSQMFELHLDMAESRLTGDPENEAKKEEWKNSKVKLPSCFDDNPKCQQFKPLIFALSNLSFEALVSDNQESSLIFNRSQAEFYGLTSQDINICLKIGLLSQNKIMVDLFQMKKMSFLHKTFQEFLAALFVFNNQSNPEKFTQLRKTDKEFDLDNVIPFISGMCSSETTCMIVNSCDKINQTTLENSLKEGWCCNHDNKHLKCDNIEIHTKHQPEHLELLCQANIHHMKTLDIMSRPTALCLEYLLQVNTLDWLIIWFYSWSSSSSSISEDNVYSLIQHNTHTLTHLTISDMTLRSRTQLSILLYNIQHLSALDLYDTTMSQQLLDSLQELKAQRPDIDVSILYPTILPDTECTD